MRPEENVSFYSVTTYHQELIELVLSNSLVPKSPLGAMPRQLKRTPPCPTGNVQYTDHPL